MQAGGPREKKKLDDSQAILRYNIKGKRFEVLAIREAVAKFKQEQQDKGKDKVKVCTPDSCLASYCSAILPLATRTR